MPATQLGNETTTVYADGADYVMERVFAAPRELVWKAITQAEHIPNWWGPRDHSAVVQQMDFRVGGHWRWVTHSGDGEAAPFAGEYLEIVPLERIVHTEMFDVEPFNQGDPALVTVTLEEVEGGTKLRSSSRFPSAEALEGALSTGMTRGAIESWDRLDEVIASL